MSVKHNRRCRDGRPCHIIFQCKPWPESPYSNLSPGRCNSSKEWLKLGRCTGNPSNTNTPTLYLVAVGGDENTSSTELPTKNGTVMPSTSPTSSMATSESEYPTNPSNNVEQVESFSNTPTLSLVAGGGDEDTSSTELHTKNGTVMPSVSQ